jgi:hypothetical protein
MTPGGFSFTYRSTQPTEMRLPLIFHLNRYWLPEHPSGGTSDYQSSISEDFHTFTWGLDADQQLVIESTSAELTGNHLHRCTRMAARIRKPRTSLSAGSFFAFPAGGPGTIKQMMTFH